MIFHLFEGWSTEQEHSFKADDKNDDYLANKKLDRVFQVYAKYYLHLR